MKISVVICTYNRAQMLRGALESLLSQSISQKDYEVIIVDNASTDNTQDVVQEFLQHDNVQYIYEMTPGLSRARNIGWRLTTGTYVAFLDDDAIPSTQWLEKTLEAFNMVKTIHMCVGGKIELALPEKRPTWLADDLLFCLSGLDCSDEPIILNNTPYFLHGCNMAFKKTTLEHFGGFNESLGRKGASLISGGETLLQKEIIKNGGSSFYHPDASVLHHVPKDRMIRWWFIKRMYWEGVSISRIKKLEKNISNKLGILRAADELVNIIKNTSRRDLLIRPGNAEFFTKLCRQIERVGSISEFLRLH